MILYGVSNFLNIWSSQSLLLIDAQTIVSLLSLASTCHGVTSLITTCSALSTHLFICFEIEKIFFFLQTILLEFMFPFLSNELISYVLQTCQFLAQFWHSKAKNHILTAWSRNHLSSLHCTNLHISYFQGPYYPSINSGQFFYFICVLYFIALKALRLASKS